MTLTKSIKIAPDALAVISKMTWQETAKGVAGTINAGQLDRKLYDAVNKALELLGGKWNRSARAHLFEQDPRQQITQMLGAGIVTVERDGFFRTPEAVVMEMYNMFQESPGFPILEPSAGDGAICDVLVAVYGWEHVDIHVVEKNDSRRSVLADKGYTVVGNDFTTFKPTTKYDAIIMNPPFEQGQDIDHITHAFENCLALGGQLVAVVSEGPFFRSDHKSKAFVRFVSQYGYSQELPENSFKTSGTGVRTRLVYLRG